MNEEIKNNQIPFFTIKTFILILLVLNGGFWILYRFIFGLGAATNLNDGFPWGLWIGFDVLSGIALAAGGFTIAAVVHIFKLKRFYPILRPTILTAFLGYFFAAFGIFMDLGQPHRIWHAIFYWNPHSVLFEVSWCVMLYLTVLACEFSPTVLEKLPWELPAKIAKAFTVPLVIAGAVISTLHQSSLGALYLIAPSKLHPLWYTSNLGWMFLFSAIIGGLSMVIFEAYLSSKNLKSEFEIDLFKDIARVEVILLMIFLLFKLGDLAARGQLPLVFSFTFAGNMFLLEIIWGILIPIVLFSLLKNSGFGLFVSSLFTVTGLILYRLNVSYFGMMGSAQTFYFPSIIEISVTLAMIAGAVLIFKIASMYLNIFPNKGIINGSHLNNSETLATS